MATLTINPPTKSRSRSEFEILQPATTYTGSPIKPLVKGLPKTTESLCPECIQVIGARLFEENGAVYMEKTCPQHGYFRDHIYSDVRLYLKMEEFEFGDNRGLENPQFPSAVKCPDDCGMCSLHTSHTVLSNVDLTNRCNLTCPVCFANANVQGYLYEPSFEQLRLMLQTLRDQRPRPTASYNSPAASRPCIRASTTCCAWPRRWALPTSSARRTASCSPTWSSRRKSHEAGLHTLYLQFDGVTDEVYLRTRGVRLLETKLACIENCRKRGPQDHLRAHHRKRRQRPRNRRDDSPGHRQHRTVSGFSFQPVCFTGRINRRELEAKRFTQSDLAHCVADQTGLTDKYDDWFPLSCIVSVLEAALRARRITIGPTSLRTRTAPWGRTSTSIRPRRRPCPSQVL